MILSEVPNGYAILIGAALFYACLVKRLIYNQIKRNSKIFPINRYFRKIFTHAFTSMAMKKKPISHDVCALGFPPEPITASQESSSCSAGPHVYQFYCAPALELRKLIRFFLSPAVSEHLKSVRRRELTGLATFGIAHCSRQANPQRRRFYGLWENSPDPSRTLTTGSRGI